MKSLEILAHGSTCLFLGSMSIPMELFFWTSQKTRHRSREPSIQISCLNYKSHTLRSCHDDNNKKWSKFGAGWE